MAIHNSKPAFPKFPKLTVVKGTGPYLANSPFPRPATLRFSGIFSPAAKAARATPEATASFPQITAEGRFFFSSSLPISLSPSSGFNPAMVASPKSSMPR